MSSTLTAHSPKFAAKLVTEAQLMALPEPLALGPLHKPVPHHVLIEAVANEADVRGMVIERTQIALAANGHVMFATFDFAHAVDGERGLSLGLRNSTDMSIAIKAVAGYHVFVCDNMALSGTMFAISRKNTTRLDLGDAMATGFDRFMGQAEAYDIEIGRLQGVELNVAMAQATAYEVFAARVMPVRLLDDVNRFYFEPEADMTDCQPRTLWGLHNAFTRAAKDLPPVRRFGATVALGKHFAGLLT